MDVADRTVEKTWPDCAIGLDDGRYPRGVAAWSRRFRQSEVCPEVKPDSTKFPRLLDNKTRLDLNPAIVNQGFNFDVELFNFLNNSTIFTRNETFGAQFYNPVEKCFAEPLLRRL